MPKPVQPDKRQSVWENATGRNSKASSILRGQEKVVGEEAEQEVRGVQRCRLAWQAYCLLCLMHCDCSGW